MAGGLPPPQETVRGSSRMSGSGEQEVILHTAVQAARGYIKNQLTRWWDLCMIAATNERGRA